MSGVRVLVVEDEVRLARIVSSYLERDGHTVQLAHDGQVAVDMAAGFRPDLVVLDIMLPGLDGLEVCRLLRARSDAYIMMLTAREDESDKVLALSLGADDYLVKPFSPRELLARVQAMLRRPRLTSARDGMRDITVGTLSMDTESHRVHVGSRLIDLTRTEYELLLRLALRPATVLSRAELIEAVWGPDWFGDQHIVDVHVANLRRKLDEIDGSRFIRTVRGVGYSLEPA